MRKSLVVTFVSISISAFAQEQIFPIEPTAQSRNHLLIVNVGEALSPSEFGCAAEKAASVVEVNVWTNSIPKSIVPNLVDGSEDIKSRFGEKSKVVVFVEKKDNGPSFLHYPAHWAVVNLRGIDKDNPSGDVLALRQAKMILKGIGYASGAGATLEPVCVLGAMNATLSGMDKARLVISPMGYFPMLQTLKEVGGDDLVTSERQVKFMKEQEEYDMAEAGKKEADNNSAGEKSEGL